MTVIDFPTLREPVSQPPSGQDFGDALEAAFDVHRMIFNAMNMGELRDSPGAIGPVLLFAMSHHFGPDLVTWAEQQFEAVYGVDARTFIDHVTSYRT